MLKKILYRSAARPPRRTLRTFWRNPSRKGADYHRPPLSTLSLRTVLRTLPVLLASLSAYGLSYVLMGFAPTLGWLFAAQCLTGLFSATHGTAYAYVTDVTPAADRPRRFGMVGAAFGLGFVIGRALWGA